MATKKLQLDNYRKSLLNRVTANAAFTDYIENCLAREDEGAKHSFHKVMIHNWSGTDVQLFDVLSEYFSAAVIPVLFCSQSEITSFYTSSLSFILKLIRLDFMFPFQRNMFNIDILFNDKTSTDCFQNSITIDDIVCSIVSRRLNDTFELDLSNFCSDPEFSDKKIHFYKISLLAHFKLLMLRMGRDTKHLNLSNNDLVQVPLDILNFFIKGDLTAINFSNNQIASVNELFRVSSKIEKLWLEGNPFCDLLDPADYIKAITVKFPRLMELDGIKINEHGCLLPFFKNYLVCPDRRTKMLVEKFLMIYFTHYDTAPRWGIESLYAPCTMFTLNTDFTEEEKKSRPLYAVCSRNFLSPACRAWLQSAPRLKLYAERGAALAAMAHLPDTQHDPASFTVDVLLHNKQTMILVVDGIYREEDSTSKDQAQKYRHYSFRRTFVFRITPGKTSSQYEIAHEMFSVRSANRQQIKNSFKNPIRNMNELTLILPEPEETEAVIKAFMHVTSLKKSEAEMRLRLQNYDIRKALKLFIPEFKDNKVGIDKMVEEDDFSDTSSLFDDEID